MSQSPFTRLGAMLLLIAALAFGVAACGDDSSSESDDSSAADTKPAAEIADLKGEATEVALDQGFDLGRAQAQELSRPHRPVVDVEAG